MQIEISDISGKKVFNETMTQKSETTTIDVKDLCAGIYFIEITTDSNIKMIKKLILK